MTISLIVLATGPERVVARAFETASCQTIAADLVVVYVGNEEAARLRLGSAAGRSRYIPAASLTPGAARNAAVRDSLGDCFLVIDGAERLPPDHAASGMRALEGTPGASFAAAAGGRLFGSVAPGLRNTGHIDAATLVGSAWTVGPAVVLRAAFDEIGGFDESLPALVEWDFLLSLTDAGKNGVMLTEPGSRYATDDVRLREALAVHVHLPAVRRIFEKHRATFERLAATAIIERERTARALFETERTLLGRRRTVVTELGRILEEIAGVRETLGPLGARTLDFGDLRNTAPVSRNWGSERGVPVDRQYIHEFLSAHADDVRGQVLEMLDADLTTTYGRDRVERSDVLDIDPGNARATLIADLRAPAQLPADAYDCFILTQTLHLIDDMSAVLEAAYKTLKPGGVLLVTMPCASMVATEYGPRGDHWRVTEAGARALFERVFRPGDLSIRARGNVLTMTAFLHGLCCDDIDPAEFAVDDPAYPMLITIRAQKPRISARLTAPATGRPSAAVLLYHRVADVAPDTHNLAVSPRALRSQLQFLRDSWQVLPLQELAAAVEAGDPPERAVALTFDDGYLDNLETAAPILAELELPATFFLTSELRRVRRRFWWDVLEEMLLWPYHGPPRVRLRLAGQPRWFDTAEAEARRATHDDLYAIFKPAAPVVRDDLLLQLAQQLQIGLTSDTSGPMLAGEIERLRQFPLIEIGAHTVHHRSLPELPPEDCHREVWESRSALERITGTSVVSFAYPFGAVSPEAVIAVTAAGFRHAVTCEDRRLRAREHRLRIPRIPTREETGAELADRLAVSVAV